MKAYVISDFESNRKRKIASNYLEKQGIEVVNKSFNMGKNIQHYLDSHEEKEAVNSSEGIVVLMYSQNMFGSEAITKLKNFAKPMQYFSYYNHHFIKISSSN